MSLFKRGSKINIDELLMLQEKLEEGSKTSDATLSELTTDEGILEIIARANNIFKEKVL